MIKRLAEYYRCPDRYLHFAVDGVLSGENGFFRFEKDCLYGRRSDRALSSARPETLRDSTSDAFERDSVTYVPFDPDQVVDALRLEQYAAVDAGKYRLVRQAVRNTYYAFRPILPFKIRRQLQRVYLRKWREVAFPRWPVDTTVDNLFEHLLRLALAATKLERIPFIWFWPEGASGCMLLTHDVETTVGRDFCPTLMDIDDSFQMKASFQVVPEQRYEVTPEFLQSLTGRGFEVVVQDLNHDGNLHQSRREFLARVEKINSYGRAWGASGFRSAILYRKQEWFKELDFSYDMSVPNVAHLDPQRGGCCTVMPYFVGDIVEMPVTTTQDYSLFHILKDYSIDLWKQQISLIMEKHGLISLIIHPDYTMGKREQAILHELMVHLAKLRRDAGVWNPTAGEAAEWWRQRASMTLVDDGNNWRIEGEGSERAHIAYASLKAGQLVYTLNPSRPEEALRSVGFGVSSKALGPCFGN